MTDDRYLSVDELIVFELVLQVRSLDQEEFLQFWDGHAFIAADEVRVYQLDEDLPM